MTIETPLNLGDERWAIAENYRLYDEEVPCRKCGAKGGANIPGTEVWVKCQGCDGEGTVHTEKYSSFDVWYARVYRISVRVDDRATEVVYDFMGRQSDGRWWGRDFRCQPTRVFTSEADARANQQRLNADAKSEAMRPFATDD